MKDPSRGNFFHRLPWLPTAALWIGGIGVLLVPVLPEPPVHSGAYVQDVRENSAVVAKIDAAPRRLALHVVPAAGDAPPIDVNPPAEPRCRHVLRANGLRPATRYRYELRDPDAADAVVDAGTFTTAGAPDAEPLRVCVFGDSGGLPGWIWLQRSPLFWLAGRFDLLPVDGDPAAIGERMAAEHPDLCLHVGDVVYPAGQHRHYAAGFFRPFADVLRHAPVYPVQGNHDYDTTRGRPFLCNFVLPENDLSGDENCWTTARGPVRFVGLNLNLSAAVPLEVSRRFVRDAFAGTTEPWRIVVQHYPFWSGSRGGDRADLIAELLPLYRELHVDLVLVGHDHNYQRWGEAPDLVQVVSGGGGKSLYPFLRTPPELKAHAEAFQFCVLDVAGARLTVRAIAGDDGRVLDEFTIDKAALVQQGKLRLDANDPRDGRLQRLL